MARVLVFAFDLNEASQIRRIRSLLQLGHEVRSLAFRRGNMNAGFLPSWVNIDLGRVPNENYSKRMLALMLALLPAYRSRDNIRSADVIVARNFDLLVLAWLARGLFGRWRVPIVYECLDIHRLFTRPDMVGALMRWCERRLLARVRLLIVSSPGFVEHYFVPIQGFLGNVSVIENKLWFDGAKIPRPPNAPRRDANGPIVLSWVGSIRCAPSLRILLQTADRMGANLQINIHGNVHRHAVGDIDAAVESRPNVRVFGPYSYPDDLQAIYAGSDLVWAQDLWQSGANSDWLLPNRIYEASWFGCPSIGVENTETGRKIAGERLGLTIPESSADALVALLHRITRPELSALSQGILDQDDRRFELRPEAIAEALSPAFRASPAGC
ncbi:succinoglycan biosynthesis protein ExoL [Roseovarius azorensis]|uniref:Succinoglycan biosynthesis protein ExoL n=1 Tax=Roseovarius azorensis TaxID=1287727 RepID=A0A1H7KPY4_9RHOB|nr:glycosyltransferase [Roseovarius azorensis]SEK88115.1 succinoglycan biosynthesis protein ExoL [Roseovarius azorensis]